MADRSPLIEERLKSLVLHVRRLSFTLANRGLMEEHKLAFAVQLALEVLSRGVVTTESGFSPAAAALLVAKVRCAACAELHALHLCIFAMALHRC